MPFISEIMPVNSVAEPLQLHTWHAREVKQYKWHARGVNVNGTQGALILREERPMSVGRRAAIMLDF